MNFSKVQKNIEQTPEYQQAKKKYQEDVFYRVGRMISEARVIRGMTQQRLAEKLSTKQSSIARIESGKLNISIGFLLKLATVFNTKLISPRFEFMKEIEKEYDPDYNLDRNNNSGSYTMNWMVTPQKNRHYIKTINIEAK